jgi:hypothetical protein
MAFVMALVQGADAVIGAIRHQPLKTFGPAFLALVTVAVLIPLWRCSRSNEAESLEAQPDDAAFSSDQRSEVRGQRSEVRKCKEGLLSVAIADLVSLGVQSIYRENEHETEIILGGRASGRRIASAISNHFLP